MLSASRIPGEGLLFGVFDLIGETGRSMAPARQGVRFSAGSDAELAAEAAEIAASRLVAELLPCARAEMEPRAES